jgi:hypothetical protein
LFLANFNKYVLNTSFFRRAGDLNNGKVEYSNHWKTSAIQIERKSLHTFLSILFISGMR